MVFGPSYLSCRGYTRLAINCDVKMGGVRKLPYVFTEQGVAMLSSVLNSKRAIMVNIQIMRAFIKIKEMLSTHADLKRKIEAMERKYDYQFKPPVTPPQRQVRRTPTGSSPYLTSDRQTIASTRIWSPITRY